MNFRLCILLALCLGGFWVEDVIAQQTLFNVPSVIATDKSRFFFQQQTNLGSDAMTFNFTTAYGLGHGWEIDLNAYNLETRLVAGVPKLLTNRENDNQPFAPLVLLTGLKQISLSDKWRIGIGTQLGLSPYDREALRHLASFSYASACYTPREDWELHMGGYYGDYVVLGGINQPGIMASYEIPITHRLHMMGDCLFGTSAVAMAVFGGVYYLNPHTSLSLG